MDLGLAGRSVLITGSSKGIGLACAHAFAAEGCDVHLVARTADVLERARADIAGRYQVKVTASALDLSDSANVDRLVTEAGDVDILVNDAGAIPAGPIDQIDEARWRAAWDLKVFGYINMTRAFLAKMKARGSGVIVNVLGTAGERPTPSYIAGSMGNASLMAMCVALGGESVDKGVRVVGVNPGLIETERMVTLSEARAQEKFGDKTRWREFLENMPQGRAGKPQEVADLVTYLASPRASWISGTVVTVDGGVTKRATL